MGISNDRLRSVIRAVIKEAIKRPSVLMHVTGNTGCGKTTLMKKLMSEYPEYIFFDLDDFGNRASKLLGWPSDWGNTSWTEEKNEQWQEVQQKLANEFIETASKPVVFFGIHHNSYNGKVMPDGSLSGGGTIMKSKWMYPGMDKSDPKIIAKVMKELEKSVHIFNDEASGLGYQPADEDKIRKILDKTK
jgi:energy-coupling factor transporter ATP-binding protein EcfA2